VKVCKKCGQAKPSEDFYLYQKEPPRYHGSCKECFAEDGRRKRVENPDVNREKCRRYAAAHREEARERAREWYAENRDRALEAAKAYAEANREAISEQRRQFRQANSDRLKEENQRKYRAKKAEYNERSARYYQQNRAKMREAFKRWRIANPARMKALRQTERGRRRKLAGKPFKAEEITALYGRQQGRCFYCGTPLAFGEFHLDHYIPLKMGGPHEITNIVIACGPCNLKKGALSPLEYGSRVV
jgi:5-methylcytosine-specific restriction endonuclease McrA